MYKNTENIELIDLRKKLVPQTKVKISKKMYQLILINIRRKTGINLIKVVKKISRSIYIDNVLTTSKFVVFNLALIGSLNNVKLEEMRAPEIPKLHIPQCEVVELVVEPFEYEPVTQVEEESYELENIVDEIIWVSDEIENDLDLEVYDYEEEFIGSYVANDYISIEGKQAGISTNNTPYDIYFTKWNKNTGQRELADEWDRKGRMSDRGIATIDGRYLVAMTSMFGVVGDNVDVVLKDGTVIPCKIADSKSCNDEMSSPYGHMLELPNGELGVDVIEWEIIGSKKDMDISDWQGKGVDYVITYTAAKIKKLD